jgi:hypothetical protein
VLLTSAAGPLEPFLIVALVLGLPIQFAVAAMVAFGRRVPASLALAVPALVLGVGGVAALRGVNDAIAAVATAADPSWIPWFALQDRARVGGTVAFAGAGGLLTCLPPLVGAAVRALRGSRRRWVGPGSAAALGVLAAIGAIVAGVETGDTGRGVLSGIAIGVLSLAGAACAVDPAPRRMTASAIGGAAFALGSFSLALGQYGGAWYGGLRALPDFYAVWSRVGALEAHAADVAIVLPALLPFVAAAGIGLLPVLLAQRLHGVDGRSAADFAGLAGIALVLVLVWGWVPFRWRTLSHLAGDHGAAVLQERRGYDVPHRALVPPRVLIADPAKPRWLLMRDVGGLEAADIVGDLHAAASTLQLGDGAVFLPDMLMEDFYYQLVDTRSGTVGITGCGDVPADLWVTLRSDPLRATGRCGAFPLRLRVDAELQHPRKLIVLKDRFLDDGGEIVAIRDVADVRDRAVIVRAQVDARMADLVALLGRLGDAGPVYLGWGVTLDGDDLPIGVNPGIRIHAPPNGGEAPPVVPK